MAFMVFDYEIRGVVSGQSAALELIGPRLFIQSLDEANHQTVDDLICKLSQNFVNIFV